MTRLEELGALLQQHADFETAREQAETALKQLNERIRRITEDEIPALMDSLGMDKITTTDGWEVKVVDAYYAKISDSNKSTAHTWLRDNGHGDLIKNILTLPFDAGDDMLAQKIQYDLTSQGFDVTVKEGVNPMTLKGFVKEQKESGNDIPDDVFGIYHKREAKMKRKTG